MNLISTETGLALTTEAGLLLATEGYLPNSEIMSIDFSVNLLQAIIWQYTEATNLQSILNQKNTWYGSEQTAFWSNWVTNVFDLRTANNFGLSVWSIILQQPIYINQPVGTAVPSWGFGTNNQNFTNGNFANQFGQTYPLSTETACVILQLRAYQLNSCGCVPEINRALAYIFEGFGQVWVIDNLNMSISYYFAFPIPADMMIAFQTYDILPRPAGVSLTIVQGG